MKKGFSLVEVLVVIAVLSIIGGLVLIIFTRTLRGNNKSQILLTIKQNGQNILETMDKSIRNADAVVMPPCDRDKDGLIDTLVIVKEGKYSRYFFDKINGKVFLDSYQFQPTELDTPSHRDSACISPLISGLILTDTDPKTGVIVVPAKNALGNDLRFIDLNQRPGFKDSVTIQFALKPGIQAPEAVAGQIDPIVFQTTIQLR